MKKIIFFIIKMIAVAGGLLFIYSSITGGGLVFIYAPAGGEGAAIAELVKGEWVRIIDGIIGLAIFMSVFTRLSDTK